MCNPEKLAAVYLDVLVNVMGMKAEVDEDGDVRIDHPEGWSLWVANTAPEDPAFLLVLTTFQADWEAEIVAAACMATTAKVKGAQLTPLSSGGFRCAVEMLVAPASCLPTREHLAAILPRALQMVEFGLRAIQPEAERLKAAAAA